MQFTSFLQHYKLHAAVHLNTVYHGKLRCRLVDYVKLRFYLTLGSSESYRNKYLLRQLAQLLKLLLCKQPENCPELIFPVYKVNKHIALSIVIYVGASGSPVRRKRGHLVKRRIIYIDRHSLPPLSLPRSLFDIKLSFKLSVARAQQLCKAIALLLIGNAAALLCGSSFFLAHFALLSQKPPPGQYCRAAVKIYTLLAVILT